METSIDAAIKYVEVVIPAQGEAGNSRCTASRPLNRVAMQGHPWERIQWRKPKSHWVPAAACPRMS